MNIAEIRQKYPQYNDLSDGDLLLGLHRSKYSDMHVKDFMAKVDPEDNARLTISDAKWPYWKEQVEKKREGERDYERDYRVGGDVRMDPGTDAEIAARSGLQGYTFGAGDNIVGGATAAAHYLTRDDDKSLGELYQGYRGQAQGALARGRDENPPLAIGSEIAGAVLGPVNKILPGMSGQAATTAGRVGRGALAGSTGGGLYGLLESENLNGLLEGAAFGGLAGGALPLIAAPFRGAKTESVKEFAKRAPGLDDLRAQSQALFRQGDGAVLPRAELQNAAPRVLGNAARQGLDMPPPGSSATSLTPQSLRAAQRLTEESMNPNPNISFRDLDILRKQAQIPAGNMGNRTEAAIGSEMVDQIDTIIEQADPALGETIAKARKLWGQLRRSEIIENAMSKAENQASGYENGIRTQFRTILNNKKLRRGFSPEEIKAMEQTVRGSRLDNVKRQLGRLGLNIFGRNFTNTLTPVAAGGLFGPAVPIAGSVAGKLAENATGRNAELLRAMVASGQTPAQIPGRLSRLLGPQAPAVANMATDLLPIAAQPVNPLRDTLPRRQR